MLSEPTCAIRYVVTVKALKEGWDYPFAYSGVCIRLFGRCFFILVPIAQ